MQGEILASPTRTKEMILIKQPIGVVALITPVSILFGFWIMFYTVTTCYCMALVGHTELYPASSCFVLYLSVKDCWYKAFAKIMTTVHVYGALIIHLLYFWFAHSPTELIKFQVSKVCIHFMPFVCKNDLEYSGAESLSKRLWWLCRTGFWFQVIFYGICGWQSGTGPGLFRLEYIRFAVIILLMFCTHSSTTLAV
jgi:hypothetical protein